MNKTINVSTFFLSALVFGIISIHLGKDVNWDLRNYHYYNGFAIVTGNFFSNYVPAQIQTFFNPTLDVFHYLLITYLPPKVIGFILGGLQGTNFWLIFVLAFILLPFRSIAIKWLSSLCCAVLAMYGPISVSELGTTMGDLTISTFILAGLLVSTKSFVETENTDNRVRLQKLLFAGFLTGCAAGLKLTFLPYALASFISLIIVSPKNLSKKKILLLFVTGSALGFILTNGYWMEILWDQFKSPCFPFFNGIFKSPYALPINFRDPRWFPESPLEWIFYPFFFLGNHPIIELPLRTIRFALIFGLFIAYLTVTSYSLLKRHSKKPNNKKSSETRILQDEHKWILIFFITAYLIWEVTFSYYRYLAPLELLAPIIIFILTWKVISNNRLQALALIFMFVLMVGLMKAPNWGRLEWTNNSYFGIVAPSIPDPQNTLVIMTSHSPTAFVIPAFPKEVRFIRIQGNFDGVMSEQWRNKIREEIMSHDGPMFLLTTSENIPEAPLLVKPYGIEIVNNSSIDIPNYLEPIKLCRLRRTSP